MPKITLRKINYRIEGCFQLANCMMVAWKHVPALKIFNCRSLLALIHQNKKQSATSTVIPESPSGRVGNLRATKHSSNDLVFPQSESPERDSDSNSFTNSPYRLIHFDNLSILPLSSKRGKSLFTAALKVSSLRGSRND